MPGKIIKEDTEPLTSKQASDVILARLIYDCDNENNLAKRAKLTREIERQVAISAANESVTEADERPSTKPLQAHKAAAEEYLETQQMITELMEQIQAINAVVVEKGKRAGALEQDLIKYAGEYKNRAFRVKNTLLYLEDIDPRKSNKPQYKAAWEWAMGKLAALGEDMKKEAEQFLQQTKSDVPGRTELRTAQYQESTFVESYPAFVRILTRFLGISASSDAKLSALETKIHSMF